MSESKIRIIKLFSVTINSRRYSYYDVISFCGPHVIIAFRELSMRNEDTIFTQSLKHCIICNS